MLLPSEVIANVLLVTGLALLLPLFDKRNKLIRVAAVALAVYFNLRYLGWRYWDTLPAISLSWTSIWPSFVFSAEVFAILLGTWHTFLLTSATDRSREADALEQSLRSRPDLPRVDVLVATYNEPWEVLERTILSARRLDYPSFRVFVLDDGNRGWLREACARLGIEYIARVERKGFKAGNLNNALKRIDGQVILVLDADFAVAPNFLLRTVGFLDDPETALLQTPQYFVNGDPIQHNLYGTRAWPEEQKVFFEVMQPSRDSFNNAFCHGTSFIVKRSCLDEIGGFPEESITEDLYLSYILRDRGYNTRYLNEILSSGLAAGSLPEFIKQRCRWAIGTLQCLRLKHGPFRARNLSLKDRFFFLDPTLFYISHCFYLLILIAPAVFWWTGASVFETDVGHLVTMLVPRMAVTALVYYWVTDRKVVPVVSEIGRVVGLFYFVRAVFRGLIQPSGHAFMVTDKGLRRDSTTVHWEIMWPFVLIGVLTVAGMLVNLAAVDFNRVIWNKTMGLNISLSAYVLWLIFFVCLTCVERPRPWNIFTGEPGTPQGSIVRSALALTRRVFC